MIYNRSLQDYYLNQDNEPDNFIPFLLGRNAINYLIESLSIKAIILPSFICPMVVDIFQHHQVKIFYYEGLNEELQIPVNNILTDLCNIKSQEKLFFLWHDYLNIIGDIPNDLYDYLSENGIVSIVDATHSLPVKSYQSEIVIYGFRKLLNEPFGALVKLSVETASATTLPPFKLWLIFLAYRVKSALLFTFKFFNNSMLDKFLKRLSNIDRPLNFDSNSVFLYESFQRPAIKNKHRRLDYQKICSKRKRNFLRYVEKIPASLDFEKFDISCPYGFPLLVNDSRLIRKKIWNKGIHSFVLWKPLHMDIPEEKRKCSKYLSNSVVVLPVNHDLSIKDIDKIIGVINE